MTNTYLQSRTSTQKLGRCEFNQGSFPLGKGDFEGDFPFLIPSALSPSEVTGIDASFVREYEFVAKCALPLTIKDIKLHFAIKVSTVG